MYKNCTTEKMLANGLIKPQQVHSFCEMKAMLINCDFDYCKADVNQAPQKSDTTGMALYMQGPGTLPAPSDDA